MCGLKTIMYVKASSLLKLACHLSVFISSLINRSQYVEETLCHIGILCRCEVISADVITDDGLSDPVSILIPVPPPSPPPASSMTRSAISSSSGGTSARSTLHQNPINLTDQVLINFLKMLSTTSERIEHGLT